MTTIEPMNREELFENVSEIHQPVLQRILDEMIQPAEIPYIAAYGVRIKPTKTVDKGFSSHQSDRCMVLVTSWRWIVGGLFYSGGAKEIAYYKSGSRFASMFGDSFFVHYWLTPPTLLPSREEYFAKEWRERRNEFVYETNLADLPEIRTRKSFIISHDEQEFDIVELAFESLWFAFRAVDGDKIYSLIQLSRQNGGKITPSTESIGRNTGKSLVDELERLSNLRAKSLITEDEFQAAKRKLLGM